MVNFIVDIKNMYLQSHESGDAVMSCIEKMPVKMEACYKKEYRIHKLGHYCCIRQLDTAVMKTRLLNLVWLGCSSGTACDSVPPFVQSHHYITVRTIFKKGKNKTRTFIEHAVLN